MMEEDESGLEESIGAYRGLEGPRGALDLGIARRCFPLRDSENATNDPFVRVRRHPRDSHEDKHMLARASVCVVCVCECA